MKVFCIFALLTLIVVVKGAWWTAVAHPVILSLGAVLGTLELDVLNVEPIGGYSWMSFANNRRKHKTKKERRHGENRRKEFEEGGKDEKKRWYNT